jgi:hypothetical protein
MLIPWTSQKIHNIIVTIATICGNQNAMIANAEYIAKAKYPFLLFNFIAEFDISSLVSWFLSAALVRRIQAIA